MKFQLERIALFSDAVFAIAITLMMIEIKAPHLHHGDSFGHDLLILVEMLPIFLGTILSFFLIGMFWKKHHDLMRYMAAYNTTVITLNLAFLLSIAFIPFSTSFMFENMDSQSAVPFLIYNLNYIVATLLGYRLFSYLFNSGNGLSHEDHQFDLRLLKREAIFQIGVYSIVIILAFISPKYAAMGYPLLAFENRWAKKK